MNRLAVVAVQEEENQLLSRRQKILQVKWKQMLRRKQLTTGDFLKESLPAVLILLHLTVG